MSRARPTPTKGGAREGAGRIPTDGAQGPFVRVTINIEETQREKLAALGGSAFIRTAIEQEYAKWLKQR